MDTLRALIAPGGDIPQNDRSNTMSVEGVGWSQNYPGSTIPTRALEASTLSHTNLFQYLRQI